MRTAPENLYRTKSGELVGQNNPNRLTKVAVAGQPCDAAIIDEWNAKRGHAEEAPTVKESLTVEETEEAEKAEEAEADKADAPAKDKAVKAPTRTK